MAACMLSHHVYIDMAFIVMVYACPSTCACSEAKDLAGFIVLSSYQKCCDFLFFQACHNLTGSAITIQAIPSSWHVHRQANHSTYECAAGNEVALRRARRVAAPRASSVRASQANQSGNGRPPL